MPTLSMSTSSYVNQCGSEGLPSLKCRPSLSTAPRWNQNHGQVPRVKSLLGLLHGRWNQNQGNVAGSGYRKPDFLATRDAIRCTIWSRPKNKLHIQSQRNMLKKLESYATTTAQKHIIATLSAHRRKLICQNNPTAN